MNDLKDQLRIIVSDLNKLSEELECRGIERTAAAGVIRTAATQISQACGCSDTPDHAPRPVDLPTAKRKRHTSVIPTNSEDNCSDSSAYGLSVRPCDRESPCRQEESYQTVLRENHVDLMNDLQLDSTQLLDQLVEDEVMCVADAESLRRIRNRREKTRTLLTQLAAYGPKKYDKFKNALRFSHQHLFKKLVKTESKHQGILPAEECVACKIARDVDIKDVVDHLYMAGVLLREDLQNVLQRHRRRESWIIIFKCIKTNKGTGIDVLWKSLKHIYPDIAEAVKKETDYIKCHCRKPVVNETDNTNQSQLSISRTASGPYTVIDNPYMSLPHNCIMAKDSCEHTYEQCDDVSDHFKENLYYNVNKIGSELQDPHYENGELQQKTFEVCQTKDVGIDGKYTRSYSWDNGMYYHSMENISGEEDPTYLHPCDVDTLPCLTGDRNRECVSPGNDESIESTIVRRGAFRRKCGRESK
ncbi:uncharacterized protein LOC132544616 [Ylistrum balloti]|uniref:uncharacterized protein LOC132544616 n=1 Tax=Ylistrum balloti TaxID=509963 RepID=UPI0029057EFE|nr:uncharacterized protein LOC132544616 [Ylistrum balloti]